MKGYQSFKVTKAFTFDEFVQIVTQAWNPQELGYYEIGKPHKFAIGNEQFFMVPATQYHTIIVTPRKNKITLTTCQNEEGAVGTLTGAATQLTLGSVVGGIASSVSTRSIEKDRKGPAEDALQACTSHMKRIFAPYLQ